MALNHKSSTLPANLRHAPPKPEAEQGGFLAKLKKKFKFRKGGRYDVGLSTGDCENVSVVSFRQTNLNELPKQVSHEVKLDNFSERPVGARPVRSHSDRYAPSDLKLKKYANLHNQTSVQVKKTDEMKQEDKGNGNNYSFLQYESDPSSAHAKASNSDSKTCDNFISTGDSRLDMDDTSSPSSLSLDIDPGYETLDEVRRRAQMSMSSWKSGEHQQDTCSVQSASPPVKETVDNKHLSRVSSADSVSTGKELIKSDLDTSVSKSTCLEDSAVGISVIHSLDMSVCDPLTVSAKSKDSGVDSPRIHRSSETQQARGNLSFTIDDLDEDDIADLDPGYAECADAIKGLDVKDEEGSLSKNGKYPSSDVYSLESIELEPGYAECADALKNSNSLVKISPASKFDRAEGMILQRVPPVSKGSHGNVSDLYANPQILFRKLNQKMCRNSGDFTKTGTESVDVPEKSKSMESLPKKTQTFVEEKRSPPPLPARNYSLYVEGDDETVTGVNDLEDDGGNNVFDGSSCVQSCNDEVRIECSNTEECLSSENIEKENNTRCVDKETKTCAISNLSEDLISQSYMTTDVDPLGHPQEEVPMLKERSSTEGERLSLRKGSLKQDGDAIELTVDDGSGNLRVLKIVDKEESAGKRSVKKRGQSFKTETAEKQSVIKDTPMAQLRKRQSDSEKGLSATTDLLVETATLGLHFSFDKSDSDDSPEPLPTELFIDESKFVYSVSDSRSSIGSLDTDIVTESQNILGAQANNDVFATQECEAAVTRLSDFSFTEDPRQEVNVKNISRENQIPVFDVTLGFDKSVPFLVPCSTGDGDTDQKADHSQTASGLCTTASSRKQDAAFSLNPVQTSAGVEVGLSNIDNYDNVDAGVSKSVQSKSLHEDSEPVHMSLAELYIQSNASAVSEDVQSYTSMESGTVSNDSQSLPISPLQETDQSNSMTSSTSQPNSMLDTESGDESSPPGRPPKVGVGDSHSDSGDEDTPPAIPPRRKIVRPSKPVSSIHRDFMESMRQLKDCGWYWGPLSWEEAESKLGSKPEGSFLVRDSSDERYILSLSFKNNGRVHHTRIEHHKGQFSFWSQPDSHGKSTIKDFIEQCVLNSRNGRFLYFIRPSGPGAPPLPIFLLHPISRFIQMRSLQHMCRFTILQIVRRDHIDNLPIPTRIKGYLKEAQYYVEYLDD